MASDVTVIIGFADALSAPEVLWSLTASGFRVVAFAKKGTRPALLKSRFVQVEYIADPADSVEAAVRDLLRIVSSLPTPALMPLDDASLWMMQELSKRENVRIAGATGSQAEIALDKRLQIRAAQNAGFLVPATIELETREDLETVSSFPVIVKPALAARAGRDRLGRGRSYEIGDARELAQFAAKWDCAEPMLIQPLIEGVGEGLFGFALENGVVCWSAHRRLRMMNPSGSGASACVSTKPQPDICETAAKFLNAIRWRGMFMIELLRAVDGRLWFIELNGRAWGSMALARRRGFEYPAWNAHTVLNRSFVPSAPALQGEVVCRHLGRELMHLAFVWRGPKSRQAVKWPSFGVSLRRVLHIDRRDYWYNYNTNDPRLFWAETWQTLTSFLPSRAGKKRGIASRCWNRLSRPIVRRQQAKIRRTDRIIDLLRRSKNVLFVCYGNINRSALAEQHLKQLVGSDMQVSSCGFHLPDGRPLDPTMHSLAQKFGVHFPTWSSRCITHQSVEAADLIFAMEAGHLVRLFQEYPESRGKAFLLSSVTHPGTIPLEIQDPFGRTPDVYEKCIQEVTYATTVISRLVNDFVGKGLVTN